MGRSHLGHTEQRTQVSRHRGTIGLFRFGLFVARIDLRPESVSHCCDFVCHCGNCIFYTPPMCALAASRPLTCTYLTFWPSRDGCPRGGEQIFQGVSKYFRKISRGEPILGGSKLNATVDNIVPTIIYAAT